ncbi:PD-(D/E)XK nuclease family protein [Muricauda sp. CAU 1633]|uniref:PD-(D/E)XK nuclease family protein n=1 Tax=Allomuricauda sp. CAU 1633 TaxID=2816036 RepID=UPI001A8D0461|nr:PD-(D/E)XK nuclease family protein [Muricauda sp. CAU 1633]MBO0321107.1 PD-(D/E)XK nuclease family protein [Muricauda sp. CAU 1633]
MHQSFLEYVLSDLQNKGTDFSECTFVLPSKRSGTFLKKHLANTLTKNIFSPDIQSIQDFIADISGMEQTSNLDLLLVLYEVYKDSPIEEPDDFPSFLKWGQTLLQDFNEMDGYLIPAHDLLNYLSAIKEISHWSVKKEKTELVQNYLQLWNKLETIYNAFSKTLKEQKRAYQGLMAKIAVSRLEDYSQNHNTKPIIFVGFNALTTAESKIVQHFLELGNGQVYWDIDSYFLDDPVHDAGLFIRNYQRNWPYYKNKASLKPQHNFLSSKKILITGVPKSISQTKYVGQLLHELNSNSAIDFSKTAVVLADESLLSPMLQAVPPSINATNITMGLPLNKTVLYSFFMALLELNANTSERGWFYKYVLELISNPYCLTLSTSGAKDFAPILAKDIKEQNWLYVTTSVLTKYAEDNSALETLFPKEPISVLQWTNNCLLLIDRLKNIFQEEKNALELEQVYRFYTLFNQLKDYLAHVDFITELKSIKNLFKQLTSMETLDFIGEPLSGLQIMGMLESRNLDFETVIITSVNEGILPSGKMNNSFIPFDVKRDYDLPTYKEKDAIYVYHFYRLIQRAKNVYIIYNTEPDVLEGGEKSRLISQLLTDENIAPFVTHTIAAPHAHITPAQPLEINKGSLLIDDIIAFAHSGFSPTSLTNYVRNPIDFYTRNILKINDLDEVEENIAANTFGTIVHDSLEELYTPLLGTTLSKENVAALKPKISAIVKGHFQKNLSGVDISKGKFLLVYNVICKYLENFIDIEIKELQNHTVKLLALEEKYDVQLHIPELDFPVKLKGTLDRVDEFDGITRIIDYKTGKVESKNVKLTDWEELITNYDKSKAFQLLCYALLYSKKHDTNSLLAGIYSFKNLGQGLFSFSQDKNNTLIDAEVLSTFEGYLKQLILEICNPDNPLIEKAV